MRRFAVALGTMAMLIAFSAGASAEKNRLGLSQALVAQATPTNYVTWYYNTSPTPTPITGAYASVGGALGGGYVYNTNGTSGVGMLNSGACLFICFGAPGVASSSVIAVGNDVNPTMGTFTTLGAPDDCTSSTAPLCPGGVDDKTFAIEGYTSPAATPTVLAAVDENGDFGTYSGFYAGAAVVAGAGIASTAPSPSPGSLVSHTGAGTGDILMGSAADYAACDYGETRFQTLTCNKPLVVAVGSSAAA